jgi:putative ABC transport system permease protein
VLRLLRQISVRQLRTSWGRTGLVVGGIATGVALIVAINVTNTSIVANLRDTIQVVAGPAALEVTLGAGEVGFDEDTVSVVAAQPGVDAAVASVRGTIALARDARETLTLLGVDLTAETDLARYHTLVLEREDTLTWLNDLHGIGVTTEFAARHGLALDDTIRLWTPQGMQDFHVRALLEPEGIARAYGGELVVMDLPAAQILLGKDRRIDQIDVVLRPGIDVEDARIAIQTALPSVLRVRRPEQRSAQYERFFASFQAMLTGISTLCLLAGIFIIFNTTSTSAVNRASAIAALELIGADAGRLFRLLLVEAAVLGVVGTGLGLVIGVALARLLSGLVVDSMGVIYKLRLPVTVLAVDWRQLVVIAAVGPTAALVASWYAARRITSMELLTMLRSGVRLGGVQPSMRRLLLWWAALVALAGGLLVAQARYRWIALGNVGATVWNASVIVLSISLAVALAPRLSRFLPRLFRAEGKVAAASLFQSPTRTGVTVAAIALVFTAATVLTTLSESFRVSVSDYVARLMSADLVVSAVATDGGYLETPLPGNVTDEIARLAFVRRVDALRVVPGQVWHPPGNPSEEVRIGLLALTDGFFSAEHYPSEWFHEGDPAHALAALRAGNGVNVSTVLADSYGLHVGDDIQLETPRGVLRLPIVGIVPDFVSDRGSVILNRRTFTEHWNDSTVNRVMVDLRIPPAQRGWAVRRIAKEFKHRHRLKVLDLNAVLAYHDGYRRRAFQFTDAVQLLIIIVTVAGIFDLLLSAIVERRRELAVWRLIGADDRTVRRSVVIESATVGTLAVVLGLPVGWVTSWIWVRLNFPHLLGYDLTFHFPLGFAAWYAALVVVATMTTGFVAAREATRRGVLDGIRTD